MTTQFGTSDLIHALEMFDGRYNYVNVFADDLSEHARQDVLRNGPCEDGSAYRYHVFPAHGVVRLERLPESHQSNVPTPVSNATLGQAVAVAAERRSDADSGSTLLGILVGDPLPASESSTPPVRRVFAIQFDPRTREWAAHDGSLIRWMKEKLLPPEPSGPQLTVGTRVLRDRYTLDRALQGSKGAALWSARDEEERPFLVKAWNYKGERPGDVERALWDLELRNLLRIASSPGAERYLAILHDAGIDRKHRQLVMVLRAPGLSSLEEVLGNRSQWAWLREWQQPPVRAALWQGLRGLARGLWQLHDQQMLHRALDAVAVLVDPEQGPESLRLAGFDWTVRLGTTTALPAPELAAQGGAQEHSFESDWFLFGALAARILLRVEPDSTLSLRDRLERLLQRIRSETKITELERDLMIRLLTPDPQARLARGDDVVAAIDNVIGHLELPARPRPNSYLALIILVGPGQELTKAIVEQDEAMNALDSEGQRRFIEQDLVGARLILRRQPGRQSYVLVGRKLCYRINEHYVGTGKAPGLWDLAFCGQPAELTFSEGGTDEIDLSEWPIAVFTLADARRREAEVRGGSISWKPHLPRGDEAGALRASLERFHDLFRVTNQIDLLLADAQIFAYEITQCISHDDHEEITLKEVARERPAFAPITGGMVELLRREKDENKRDADFVYLGSEEELFLDHKARPEMWQIESIGQDSVILRRQLKTPLPPIRGFLRPFDLFGQTSLVRRRGLAIARLEHHTYLLTALYKPSNLYLDTGQKDLPVPIERERLDEAKEAALRSIWRTRPIFALQGPPGTGKTTLVANLLGQIFEDDPVAQVLVSAQAHAAVDVLRDKVTKEIFQNAREEDVPLAIRLRKGAYKGDEKDRDYVEPATERMLRYAIKRIGDSPSSPLQSRWRDAAREAAAAIAASSGDSGANDLCQLVKRAANITYCTTTAGDLAELAESTQSFDWSIIEEAGKAHGFDLVLPLQSGHRWLLIGDQKQLGPYRFEDIQRALNNLDDAISALYALPKRAGGQVDIEALNRWVALDQEERNQCVRLWSDWLKVFAKLHQECAAVSAFQRAPDAPLADMLWEQHRMHPTIADLVSRTYYDDEDKEETTIRSRTVMDDGRTPIMRVVHPFHLPAGVSGKAILWLDMPSVRHGGREEVASRQGGYTAPDEVVAIKRLIVGLHTRGVPEQRMRLAVLSPYRSQVRILSNELRGLQFPLWMEPFSEKQPPAATVDSFQGDQADVVIVSLVRNNLRAAPDGLGFLDDAARMNVLFSRAERLLCLVGSWEFFTDQLKNVPRDRRQPLGRLRVAVDFLSDAFNDGRALRISATDLGEDPQ
ncbi:MAG: AAA domain-containing protein [Polyangiales bacterium]